MTLLLVLQDHNTQQFETPCFITISIIIFVVITENRNYIIKQKETETENSHGKSVVFNCHFSRQ